MPSEGVVVEISGREAHLILNYGHPFPEQAQLLNHISNKPGWHAVSMDKFWLEQILGDLSRSVKEIRDLDLQEELDGLCCSLELKLGCA